MGLYSKLVQIKRKLNGEFTTPELIKRGLTVGKGFSRGAGVFLDPSHCHLITIGDDVTISIRVIVLAHDASTKNKLGVTKIGKVVIGDNCFIGAGAIILPNVEIGKGSIVAAGSIVTKSVPECVVVAGNPARVICTVDDYTDKHSAMIETSRVFDESYRYHKKIAKEKIEEMKSEVKNGKCYID